MSHERDGINFNMLSLNSFNDERVAHSILDLLLSNSSFLKVRKWGRFAPVKERITPCNNDQILSAWFLGVEPSSPYSTEIERILCFEGERGTVNVMVNWSDSKNILNSLSGSFPIQLLEPKGSIEKFLEWLKLLTVVVNPVVGFVQNMMTTGWATPYDLSLRLPELSWGTIFGSAYIEMFGADDLRAAPFFRVEEWNSGHFFCRLTPDLRDPNLPTELRKKVREFLGPDAFMEGTRQPRFYSTGKSPNVLREK